MLASSLPLLRLRSERTTAFAALSFTTSSNGELGQGPALLRSLAASARRHPWKHPPASGVEGVPSIDDVPLHLSEPSSPARGRSTAFQGWGKRTQWLLRTRGFVFFSPRTLCQATNATDESDDDDHTEHTVAARKEVRTLFWQSRD